MKSNLRYLFGFHYFFVWVSIILVLEQNSPEGSVHHCQVCKKTFSRSSLLKQHSVIHMGNKRFKFRCEVCSKMFRTRSHLRDHTRIHTGVFVCSILFNLTNPYMSFNIKYFLYTTGNLFSNILTRSYVLQRTQNLKKEIEMVSQMQLVQLWKSQ